MSFTATSDESIVLQYSTVARPLEELPQAIINRIDREQKERLRAIHDGIPVFLKYLVRVSDVTWRATKSLTLDRQHGSPPPASLAVATPPMVRTFLDALISVVFVFDDPRDRMSWYYRSGWREAAEQQDRLERRYGADPAWTEWLAKRRAWVDSHNADLGIDDQMRQDPRKATSLWERSVRSGWWPNPGKMVTLTKDQTLRAFLAFLNDWFYRQLSGEAHLSYMGLAARGGILHDDNDVHLEPNRHNTVLAALTLYVALLTEVIAVGKLDYEAGRMRDLWKALQVEPRAGDLWNRRYRALLGVDAQSA